MSARRRRFSVVPTRRGWYKLVIGTPPFIPPPGNTVAGRSAGLGAFFQSGVIQFARKRFR